MVIQVAKRGTARTSQTLMGRAAPLPVPAGELGLRGSVAGLQESWAITETNIIISTTVITMMTIMSTNNP